MKFLEIKSMLHYYFPNIPVSKNLQKRIVYKNLLKKFTLTLDSMDIIKQDFKKGIVKLRTTDQDDLWYLSHLIDSGDFVRGTTTRKIKIGENENAKVVKKKITLTIEAEKIEYIPDNKVVRVNGKITEGPDDFPKGSYQNISLEISSEFSIQKVNWLKYQKDKLSEACKKKYNYLICLFDREEAMFALSKKFGFEILVRIKSDMQKKGDPTTNKSTNYYNEIIKAIETYQARNNTEKVILASPAFYREDLLKLIKDQDLKKRIVSVICSSVGEPALQELMRRPELKEVLRESRNRVENLLVEELLSQIGQDGNYSYGKKEVLNTIQAGAVSKLLLTDKFIKKEREEGNYADLDSNLKNVDNLNGEVHILSSENEAGKRVDGLGGIAAILRYKMNL